MRIVPTGCFIVVAVCDLRKLDQGLVTCDKVYFLWTPRTGNIGPWEHRDEP